MASNPGPESANERMFSAVPSGSGAEVIRRGDTARRERGFAWLDMGGERNKKEQHFILKPRTMWEPAGSGVNVGQRF